jgi:hypothetical protein
MISIHTFHESSVIQENKRISVNEFKKPISPQKWLNRMDIFNFVFSPGKICVYLIKGGSDNGAKGGEDKPNGGRYQHEASIIYVVVDSIQQGGQNEPAHYMRGLNTERNLKRGARISQKGGRYQHQASIINIVVYYM